jgi:hypothetical protein
MYSSPIALILATLAVDGTKLNTIDYPDFFRSQDIRVVGSASTRNGSLRLTPSKQMQRGAAWRTNRVAVRDGFETSFRFQISDTKGLGPGADGFAFVIQNAGPAALAGRGASGGFAFGHNVRDQNRPGIENSLAVFFDTFQNESDASDNSVSICTNGSKGQMRWPPPQLAINARLRVEFKDASIHEARIRYEPPMMRVEIDGNTVLESPVDLGRMVGQDGMAYVGFTASTGEGFENHDILSWQYSSRTVAVDSSISFARFDCMPSKSLCTPAEAIVEELGTGRFHVIVPAHLPWAAQIANPSGAAVEVRELRGLACLGSATSCGSPVKHALRQRTANGRTWFTLTDIPLASNQGYYEFEAVTSRESGGPK